MINDLQKLSERKSDPIIKLIININKNDNSIISFSKDLIKLGNILKKNICSKKEWKIILKDYIRIFLFKKLVLKNSSVKKLIEINKVPKEIIAEFESHLNINKKECKDIIFRQNNIVPKKNSRLDKWIKKEFLTKVKKYFRGIVGYKVHARYAINNGELKSSKRFKYSYTNLHWDYALNAMPYVIYLSDVNRGDGEFKILRSSIGYDQNLYLSNFDYFLSNKNGIRKSIMSNRVGSHLDNKNKTEIENDMIHFCGEKGTSIFFAGRYILHCGGYPEINNDRLSVFLSHKNLLMGVINKLVNIIDYL